jgi:hypothetical protein
VRKAADLDFEAQYPFSGKSDETAALMRRICDTAVHVDAPASFGSCADADADTDANASVIAGVGAGAGENAGGVSAAAGAGPPKLLPDGFSFAVETCIVTRVDFPVAASYGCKTTISVTLPPALLASGTAGSGQPSFTVSIDVGWGDSIFPAAELISFPRRLQWLSPKLNCDRCSVTAKPVPTAIRARSEGVTTEFKLLAVAKEMQFAWKLAALYKRDRQDPITGFSQQGYVQHQIHAQQCAGSIEHHKHLRV